MPQIDADAGFIISGSGEVPAQSGRILEHGQDTVPGIVLGRILVRKYHQRRPRGMIRRVTKKVETRFGSCRLGGFAQGYHLHPGPARSIHEWGKVRREDVSPGPRDKPEEVLRVRIRRPKGDLKNDDDPKYMLLTGSGQASMVLPPVGVAPSLAVWVVVEAELDAIAVHHACRGKVGALAVLTNLGKPDVLAHALLSESPLILVALDFDKPDRKGKRPGYQGWLWWQEHYGQARRWPVSEGKDPGDTYKAGYDLGNWISAALPESLAITHAGSLGPADSGLQPVGEGEKAKPKGSAAKPQAPKQNSPRRWPHAGGDTPLSEATLPKGCPSIGELRRAFAGKDVNDDMVVTCPKVSKKWWWTHYHYCRKCCGHPECIVDFQLSPQMRAPLDDSEENNA